MAESVAAAVSAGLLVRARADADTVEARAGFTGRRDAVIAAGAHVSRGSCWRCWRLCAAIAHAAAAADQRRRPASRAPSALPQVVASDYAFGEAEQLRVPAAAGASPYRVWLPGGRPGRCLWEQLYNGTVPVQQAAVGAGDGTGEPAGDEIFCGPAAMTTPPVLAFDGGSSGSTNSGASSTDSGSGAISGESRSEPDPQLAPQPQEARSGAAARALAGLPALLISLACLLAVAAA